MRFNTLYCSVMPISSSFYLKAMEVEDDSCKSQMVFENSLCTITQEHRISCDSSTIDFDFIQIGFENLWQYPRREEPDLLFKYIRSMERSLSSMVSSGGIVVHNVKMEQYMNQKLYRLQR